MGTGGWKEPGGLGKHQLSVIQQCAQVQGWPAAPWELFAGTEPGH